MCIDNASLQAVPQRGRQPMGVLGGLNAHSTATAEHSPRNNMGDEVAREYAQELEELTRNERTRINFLTMTAHDVGAEHADAIVKCIEERIYKVSR